jgi:hypothetical protein
MNLLLTVYGFGFASIFDQFWRKGVPPLCHPGVQRGPRVRSENVNKIFFINCYSFCFCVCLFVVCVTIFDFGIFRLGQTTSSNLCNLNRFVFCIEHTKKMAFNLGQ